MPARSAPRPPGKRIPGPVILREGEPPCEPFSMNSFSQMPALSAARPPGKRIPRLVILREGEPPCEPVLFHINLYESKCRLGRRLALPESAFRGW